MKALVSAVTLLASAVCLVSCSGADTQKTPEDKTLEPQPISLTEPDANKHAVMVIDDGFDLNDDVFQNKVIATYTIKCSVRGYPRLSESELKQLMLSEFAKADDRCRIEQGINFRPSAKFESIASYRAQWNHALLTKTSLPFTRTTAENIINIVTGEKGKYNYHGTATAGTVAYQNDDVQLILVQKELATHASTVNEQFSCLTKKEIEEELRIYKDADIQQAYIERPLSTEDEAIQKLITEHNVNLVNLSLGRLTREGYLKIAEKKNCDKIDLTDYYKTVTALEAKRTTRLWEKGLIGTKHLTLQAAGNDGVQIDSGADAFECTDKAHNRLLVGALTAAGNATEFTNFGKCVDVYTMGDNMVVAAPRKFVGIMAGTSFSTPMLLRYISKTFSRNMAPQEVIEAITKQANENKFMPNAIWPSELAWENKSNNVVAYNFTQGLMHSPEDFTNAAAATLQQVLAPALSVETAPVLLPRLW